MTNKTIRTAAIATIAVAGLGLAAAPATAAGTHWAVTAIIPSTVPGGQGVEYTEPLAIDETRNLIYAGSFYSGDNIDPSHPRPETSKIFTIDGATNTIVDTLDLSCGCDDYLYPDQMVVDPELNALFVPYLYSSEVGVFSGYGGPGSPVALAQTITIDAGGNPERPDSMPYGTALDPVTHTVYVTDGDDNGWLDPSGGRVYAIDGQTYAVTRLGDDGGLDGLLGNPSFDTASNTLFVPVSSNTYVAQFAAAGSSLVEGPGLFPPVDWNVAYPADSAMDSSRERLYVTNLDSTNVTVYDTSVAASDPDASAIALIDLPGMPLQIDVDSTRGLVFVAGFTGDAADSLGWVWIIDGATNAIVDTVAVPGTGASYVRVNDATGRVYVTSVDPIPADGSPAGSSLVVLEQVPNSVPTLAATGIEPLAVLLPLGAGLAAVGIAIAVTRKRRAA